MTKRNLKEQVIAFKLSGKTQRQIIAELGCSSSTVSYHLHKKTRDSTFKRTQAIRARADYAYPRAKTVTAVFKEKINQFHRRGKKLKTMVPIMFDEAQLRAKYPGETALCYLTGRILKLDNSGEFSLDHKIPVSKGGTSTIENLGICALDVNQAKSAKTPEEFIALCQEVLLHNGYHVTAP